MSKYLLAMALGLTSLGGLALVGPGQPLYAESPPAPARDPDTKSCCYSSYADAEYDGETEIQMGNYYAYRIVQLDANHWELWLWARR